MQRLREMSASQATALRPYVPRRLQNSADLGTPETLLVAAVADCFILTFRAIAKASKLSWISLKCEVEGTLDRIEGRSRFTQFLIRATLSVPQDTKEDRALRLLEKAEQGCLITNSLSSTTRLDAVVVNVP